MTAGINRAVVRPGLLLQGVAKLRGELVDVSRHRRAAPMGSAKARRTSIVASGRTWLDRFGEAPVA